MAEPVVYPKGKRRRQAEKADYRCDAYTYVRRMGMTDGTAGVVRDIYIRQSGYLKVNGTVVYDPTYEVKPGDIISFQKFDDELATRTATAEEIEKCW